MKTIALFVALSAVLVCAGANAAPVDNVLRTIIVSGDGQVTATPDEVRLTAGVVNQASTAAAALDANSKTMNDVYAALKQLAIPNNKIRTSNFSLTPQYSITRPGSTEPRRIVGYQASNQVTVIINDTSKAGTTLDALVKSGANESYGFSF
jgi:uncharacterized protein YggE